METFLKNRDGSVIGKPCEAMKSEVRCVCITVILLCHALGRVTGPRRGQFQFQHFRRYKSRLDNPEKVDLLKLCPHQLILLGEI